jgi:hypothetical protein
MNLKVGDRLVRAGEIEAVLLGMRFRLGKIVPISIEQIYLEILLVWIRQCFGLEDWDLVESLKSRHQPNVLVLVGGSSNTRAAQQLYSSFY